MRASLPATRQVLVSFAYCLRQRSKSSVGGYFCRTSQLLPTNPGAVVSFGLPGSLVADLNFPAEARELPLRTFRDAGGCGQASLPASASRNFLKAPAIANTNQGISITKRQRKRKAEIGYEKQCWRKRSEDLRGFAIA